uniref:Uncharacterized protein n=1 Tax=Anguilla anguilla TaxID=7936 RepID=A0A0E9XDC9_ANGAN
MFRPVVCPPISGVKFTRLWVGPAPGLICRWLPDVSV